MKKLGYYSLFLVRIVQLGSNNILLVATKGQYVQIILKLAFWEEVHVLLLRRMLCVLIFVFLSYSGLLDGFLFLFHSAKRGI